MMSYYIFFIINYVLVHQMFLYYDIELSHLFRFESVWVFFCFCFSFINIFLNKRYLIFLHPCNIHHNNVCMVVTLVNVIISRHDKVPYICTIMSYHPETK